MHEHRVAAGHRVVRVFRLDDDVAGQVGHLDAEASGSRRSWRKACRCSGRWAGVVVLEARRGPSAPGAAPSRPRSATTATWTCRGEGRRAVQVRGLSGDDGLFVGAGAGGGVHRVRVGAGHDDPVADLPVQRGRAGGDREREAGRTADGSRAVGAEDVVRGLGELRERDERRDVLARHVDRAVRDQAAGRIRTGRAIVSNGWASENFDQSGAAITSRAVWAGSVSVIVKAAARLDDHRLEIEDEVGIRLERQRPGDPDRVESKVGLDRDVRPLGRRWRASRTSRAEVVGETHARRDQTSSPVDGR